MRYRQSELRRCLVALTVAAVAFGAFGATAAGPGAARPSAIKLFPRETVLWVRTADAGLLVERLQQTSWARLADDPEVADLSGRIGDAMTDAYNTYAQSFFDADLEQLLRLPQGEVAFGLIARPEGEPGLLLVADFGEQAQVAQQVFERLQELAEEDGRSVSVERLRSDDATVIRDGNDQDRVVAVVRRGNTFVAANDRELMQATLDHWDEIPVAPAAADGEAADAAAESEGEPPLFAETLSANARFSATFRELMPGNEEPPQAMFFIDPIGLLKATAGRNAGMRIAMATFPALGVDGIQAFGAAGWFATDKWDSLLRGHLLLANPRAGVVKVARLETGETAPPGFVPVGFETCASLRLDPQRLFDDIASLYDKFQYKGAFRKLVADNLSANLPIDFEQDFVGNLTGSLFYITGYDDTGRSFGAKPNVAVGVKDVEAAQASLTKLQALEPDDMVEQSLGSVTYYELVNAGPGRRRPREERPFIPCVGLIGEHLVASQSTQVFRQMVEAHEGSRPRLVESLQHRLVMSRLKRMTGGRPLSAVLYRDSEPGIRHMHQMATSDKNRERLDRFAEDVTFLRYVRDVLDGADIPPVETLLRYSTPGGSAIVDTPTGWSMIGFSFKPPER